MNHRIIFKSLDRLQWVKTIIDARDNLDKNGTMIIICFGESINKDSLEPIHIVTLACLIEHFDEVSLGTNTNKMVCDYLTDVLRIKEYWAEEKNHTPARDENIFNLWRIVEDEKEHYAQQVKDFFSRKKAFENKDLTMIGLSLIETYHNVFDHANAKGNAFSFIKYDANKEQLCIAVCDFGKGISKTVRDKFSNIENNSEALLKAIEPGFTIKSKEHNKGVGLANIMDACSVEDTFRIVANTALLVKYGEARPRAREMTIDFKGTLIYYEITISNSEDTTDWDEFKDF